MHDARGIALLGLAGLGVFSASAFAQASLDAVTVSAQQCSSAQLGAPIDPKQIGEPVSAVQIDKVDWYAGSAESPAVCVVEGQLLPLDRAPSAFPIRFAVGLPGVWNRRSIHQGGGGMNGTVPRFAPTAPHYRPVRRIPHA
ncbi:MAG TPA: hypothetical protein VIY90_13700 [Steroidobacteraceae bacterium]